MKAGSGKDGSPEMIHLGEYVEKCISELAINQQTPNTRRVYLEGGFYKAKP
jgi:hypothetical protein